MEEQDLDKISRLIHSITLKHKVNASFGVGTYFSNPQLVYHVMVNDGNESEKLHFCGPLDECIAKLEKVERVGLLPSKDSVLESINRLEQNLANQKAVLKRIEESGNVI